MALHVKKGKHAQGKHVRDSQSSSKVTDSAADNSASDEIADVDASTSSDIENASEASDVEASSSDVETASTDTDEAQDSADDASEIDPDDIVFAPLPSDDQESEEEQSTADQSIDVSGFTSIMPEGLELKKKYRPSKIAGITLGIIFGVILIAYVSGAVVFMNKVFPQTTAIGLDLSMMSNQEVGELLDETVDNYTLDVLGEGFEYRTTGTDIDLAIDSEKVLSDVRSRLSPWAWPAVLIEGSHDVSDLVEVTFKKQNYDAGLVQAVRTFNKDATPPTNASIVFDEATQQYTVVPEIPGTQYESHYILAAMDDSIEHLQPKIQLTDDFLVPPTIYSTDERIIESAAVATGLVSASVKLVLAGQEVSEINGSVLSTFIRMDEALGVTLDEAALNQWVTDLSNSFDTVGTQRTYTRADGKQITIGGGAYGWATDSEALREQVLNAIKAGGESTIDIPCIQNAVVYNGPGQRDWGNRYVDVDISEQYVRFYGDDGSIIWESACITGQPDGKHDTVPGVWKVNNKESPSKLIGYEGNVKEYETTVAYWMAFEANSIGFHDATWQPSFGGNMYATGYGSHGCVNLPYNAAESLYGIITHGDVVVVHF